MVMMVVAVKAINHKYTNVRTTGISSSIEFLIVAASKIQNSAVLRCAPSIAAAWRANSIGPLGLVRHLDFLSDSGLQS
jgi:hypothetical protein